ncbi:hypothetical protein LXM25_28290 [Dyadobacter sp. LJ53]|uniref:hypothetical protein n=1 Tax=Dyadobacter chenwenxiniae TaxID=2906456 RepID=UPI001F46E62B|nr:hypothetical protein [Dyadobacter chenwenxiniae]MCF0054006.1 hypothetical protein [Dyadobacter chenwenxiniae]
MINCCFTLVVLFVSTLHSLCAQTKKKDAFPTYEQIRGNKSEIYDFVTPQSVPANPTSTVPKSGKYTLTKRSIVTEHGFDLFGYPQDSVTYILIDYEVKK